MSNRKVVDFWMREAHKKGYAARSAFKLKEIQEKFRVISKGGAVLDLGCSPGAWVQVACESLGHSGGQVVGLDLDWSPESEIPKVYGDRSRVTIHKADVFKVSPSKLLAATCPAGFTCVLSDMLHKTTGDACVDVPRSIAFASRAIELAVGSHALVPPEEAEAEGGGKGKGVLRPGGSFVAKVLDGSGVPELRDLMKPLFGKVTMFRPKATRRESREVYLVAMSLRPRAAGILLDDRPAARPGA